MFDTNLINKTAFVCGSTQGIGKATAMLLAEMGANIVLIARNKEALEETKSKLKQTNQQQHHVIVADFADASNLKTLVEAFVLAHGSVHILVNNSGGPAAGNIEKAEVKEFLSAFNNHLVCNHILAQALLPGMKTAGYGRIINIISTSVKQPLHGLGVSNTIRAAVANWSKTLSLEVASLGITVNNVLPGATLTGRLENIITNKSEKQGISKAKIEEEMLKEIPAKRFGNPNEIAAAIAFLASPAAAYINGINLPVDGGRTGCL
jgi:3-oxoacyl-[acyl-carrier protein] reductase